MAIKLELEIDEADAEFLSTVARRTGTTVEESLHALLFRARELERNSEPTEEPYEEPEGFSHLDYLRPLDIPDGEGLVDGSINHDFYLHQARLKKMQR